MILQRIKQAALISALMLGSNVAFGADSTTIDYSAPVCVGLDGDACIEKLNTFCAIPENERYTDCIEWQTIQSQVSAGANNSGTTTETTGGSGGGGGGGGGGGNAATLMFSPSAFATQQGIGMIQQFFTCKSAMSEEEKNLKKGEQGRWFLS